MNGNKVEARLHMELAWVYEEEGKFDLAVKELKKAIGKGCEDGKVIEGLGRMYRIMGDSAAAARELEKALGQGPVSPGMHAELGRAYRGLGRNDQAMSEFDKALGTAGKDASFDKGVLHMEKALIFEEGRKYGLAAEEIKKALETGYDEKTAHKELGKIYSSEGRYDEAIKELESAIRCGLDTPEVRAELGYLLYEKGDYSAAAGELKESLQGGFDTSHVHAALGRIYDKQGRYDEALKEFSRALEIEPGSGRFHDELGRIYDMKGDLDSAIREFRIAIDNEPSNGEYNSDLGKVYLRKKELKAAEREFRLAIENGYDKGDVHKNLGHIYCMNNRDEKAVDELHEALRLKPDSGEYNAELMKIHERNRAAGLVEKELRNAIEKGYEDENICIGLARLHRSRGEYGEAVRAFRRAADISSNRELKSFRNWMLNEIEITQKKTRLESKPRSLCVCLTTRCNLRCIMCDTWGCNYDLPDKIVAEIRDLLPYLQFVTWLGGESFMAPSFRELSAAAAACPGLQQCIVTNGLLIEEDWLRRNRGSNMNLVISIDGVTKSTYEKIRAGSDFETLQKKLDLVNKYRDGSDKGISLTMQTVVMKENYRDIGKIMDFLKRFRINRLQFVPLNDSINRLDSVYYQPEVREHAAKAIKDLAEKTREEGICFINGIPIGPQDAGETPGSGDKHEPARKAPEGGSGEPAGAVDAAAREKSSNGDMQCLFPWQLLNMDARGYVTSYCYCPVMEIGNANESDIMDIWNCDKMLTLREKIIGNTHSDWCNSTCVEGIIPREALRVDY
ncbi:MAG: tetratricopeptide repeat protein [Elusimicrobia bacterium]|nr:tetratricopeptide repeat protein [Elusimicrobiota bacterium]